MIALAQLRQDAKNFLRFGVSEPLRFSAGVLRVALPPQAMPLCKVLLTSDGEVYTSEQQFAPLLDDRAALRKRYGVAIRHQQLAAVLAAPEASLQQYDVVGLKLSFQTPAAEALRITQAVKQAIPEHTKLIYFDGDDDSSVQWPELLPLVDLYVKKHCFREKNAYREPTIGKSNLTDYVSRTFGISFADDIIPTGDAVDERQLDKIVVGWNIGLDDKIRGLYDSHSKPPLWSDKDNDVVCRATVSSDAWIYPLRAPVIEQVRSLDSAYKVLVPEQRVPQDVYYQEMLRSKVCVSPFGYGEICWRDFEAVLCGCVLVKPDMSHVQTEPDIFVPGETYIPVKWDFSDLPDVLARLLDQPDECERLRSNAFGVLKNYFEHDGAILSFGEILNRIGCAQDVRGSDV